MKRLFTLILISNTHAMEMCKTIQLPQLITVGVPHIIKEVRELSYILKRFCDRKPARYIAKELKYRAEDIGKEYKLSPQSEELLINNLIRKQKNEPYSNDYPYDHQYELDNYNKIVAQWHPTFIEQWQKINNEEKIERYIFRNAKKLVDIWYKYAGRRILNSSDKKYERYKYKINSGVGYFYGYVSPQMEHILVTIFDAWLQGEKINPDFRFSQEQDTQYYRVLINKFPIGFGFRQWCLKHDGYSQVRALVHCLFKYISTNANSFKKTWGEETRWIIRDVKTAIDYGLSSQNLSPQSTMELIKDFIRICKHRPSLCSNPYSNVVEERNWQELLNLLPDEDFCTIFYTKPDIKYRTAELMFGYISPSNKNVYTKGMFTKRYLKNNLQDIEDFLINKLLYDGKDCPARYGRKGSSSKTKWFAKLFYEKLNPLVIEKLQEKADKNENKYLQRVQKKYQQQMAQKARMIRTFFKKFESGDHPTIELPKLNKQDHTTLLLWPLSHNEQLFLKKNPLGKLLKIYK